MSATAPRSNRWLFGPAPDLLIGCGVGYIAIFALMILALPQMQAVIPLALLPLLSVFFGTPHYGATLLRVYEQRSERRAYAFFTVYVTAVIWALYYIGLYSPMVGTVLLTVYLTWSPWHYTGQNYGIALMFLRRRGVEITPIAKRAIHLSFVLSYVLTFLAIHGVARAVDYAPVESYSGSIYSFRQLGIPSPYWEIGFAVVGAFYAVSLGVAAVLLLRRAPARELLPTALLALTQMLWFSLPPLGRELGLLPGVAPLQAVNAGFLFAWVAAGHAAQYLWVTSYYAQREATGGQRARYYARCVCFGSAIWSIPVLIYTWGGIEGSALGGMARGLDAGVLLAAAVNLHHFVLDGAIWKLRDGKVARALIRREAEAVSLPEPVEPRRRATAWAGGALLLAGALWTVTTVAVLLETEFGIQRGIENYDSGRVRDSLQRMEWMARAGPREYLRAANGAMRIGDDELASYAYRKSLEKGPTAAAWLGYGRLLDKKGLRDEAERAWRKALELDGRQLNALFLLGSARLDADDPAEAVELLERAARLAPDDKLVAATLQRARRDLARYRAAKRES